MKKLIILLLAATALAGCKTEIDYTEVVARNGLIYKYGEKDPFNGTVVNAPPDQRSIDGLCNVQIEKGRLNGTKECYHGDQKTYEAEFSAGNKEGTEIVFSASTGKKESINNWKNNLLHGTSEKYVNGTLVSRKEYANGMLDGQELRWSADGKTILTDLTWSNNAKQTGFETTPQGKHSYLNGKLHGEQIAYGKTKSGNQYIYRDTNYSNGKLDGTFKEYTTLRNTDTPQQKLEITYNNGVAVSGWFNLYEVSGRFIQKINLVRAPNDEGKGPYDDYPRNLVPDGLIKIYDKYFDAFKGEELWANGVKLKYSKTQPYRNDEPTFYIQDPSNDFIGYSQVSKDEYLAYKTVQTSTPEKSQVVATNTQAPASEDCLDAWINAFHEEMGEDAMIVSEQLTEWKGWCSEGRLP